jgi:hypothetical protein
MSFHVLLRGVSHFYTDVYVDDIGTSQETHLWASMACYGVSFTFLYVDDVRTSQQAHASTACYGDSFTDSTAPVFVRNGT